MTRQERTKLYLGIPGAIVAGAVILFFLLNAAFVSRREYTSDHARITSTTDSLRTSTTETARLSRRILCYMQAQAGERRVSECVE